MGGAGREIWKEGFCPRPRVSTGSLVKSMPSSHVPPSQNKFSILSLEGTEDEEGANDIEGPAKRTFPLPLPETVFIPASDVKVSYKKKSQLDVDIVLQTLDTRETLPTPGLLDCGCSSTCIDRKFVMEKKINVRKLDKPLPVTNADGSSNIIGSITEYVLLHMKIREHEELWTFFVSDLGDSSVFIGLDWLMYHNPDVDWRQGKITFSRCPSGCNPDIEPVNIRTSVIPESYQEFCQVFEKKSFDVLPPHRPWDHAIDLVPNCKEFGGKVYRLSLDERRELDKFLDENLAAGKIRPSNSPYASPIFFKEKKEGSLRPVEDYRNLNAFTIKNHYPLPLISELIDQLAGAKIFTKLDVRWGFNNVRIREGDEHKAAFLTYRGLFEPLVMQFGLCNASATFQTMMNEVLKEEIATRKVVDFVDDILIFTEDLQTHREMVKRVLHKLQENHLFLKLEKCEFEQATVEFLGLTISENSVTMNESKVSAIKEWPVPQNKKGLQRFLGFINFYRRFIKDFGKIARPLHKLTGNMNWIWEDEQDKAFMELKSKICTAPVLAMPKDEGKFRIECDASGFAFGGVLSQQQADGKWHPLDFMSISMSPTERNYENYDRELLAIITALGKWRKYLLGAKEKFEIWSDHFNLTYFKKPQKLTRKQARWVVDLQQYDYTLHHIPGRLNNKADILSRRDGHDQGKGDNEDVTVLPPELFQRLLLVADAEDSNLIKRIQNSSDKVEKSVKNHILEKHHFWLETEEGLIMWKNRVYVPKDDELREDIIRLHHDPPIIGHPGVKRTEELIVRNYWWPYISKDIKLYVSGCDACQRAKPNRQKLAAPLHPNETPTRPWEIISWDLIGPLPLSNNCDAILVIVDRLTKRMILEATNMELTSEGVARVLRDRVFRDHGLPSKIICDRDPRFVSKFMKEFFRLVGIEGNPSTAYHPQTDGQTERVNQEIEQYLRIFVNYKQTDWADWMSLAEFAYNDKINSATGFSPFFLDYGQHPWKGIEPRQLGRNDSALDFADKMAKIRQDAISSLDHAANIMKRYYDKKRGKAVNYKVGDLVWLDAGNLTTMRPSKKLDYKRQGPFPVLEVYSNGRYKLQLPRQWRKHPVFNESVLLPYHPSLFPSQKGEPPPPPELVDDELEYEAEKILDSRLSRGKLQYLVKWRGYPNEENTWEPEDNLKHSPNLLDEFHHKNPSAPRRLDPSICIRFTSLTQSTDSAPLQQCWWEGKLAGKQSRLSHGDMTLMGG